MKKILFLLFVPLVSCSQLSKNDLQEENLKGQVKSVKETAFNGVEKFGEVVKGELTDYQNVNTLMGNRRSYLNQVSHPDRYRA